MSYFIKWFPIHHRSTKIRCSIFSKELPPNPPPASVDRRIRSGQKDDSNISILDLSSVLPSSSNPITAMADEATPIQTSRPIQQLRPDSSTHPPFSIAYSTYELLPIHSQIHLIWQPQPIRSTTTIDPSVARSRRPRASEQDPPPKSGQQLHTISPPPSSPTSSSIQPPFARFCRLDPAKPHALPSTPLAPCTHGHSKPISSIHRQ
ncbi:hypothetical protein ACLOJK_004794 [Asimina triloba]